MDERSRMRVDQERETKAGFSTTRMIWLVSVGIFATDDYLGEANVEISTFGMSPNDKSRGKRKRGH